ncbi:MAG: S24 family peptidase [Neisseriaceae bacterium]|nr:S24 family peptidase [Neisseriaceae bacterium]MBP6862190.1 S24 family peptidase [Neisseriaceae bacterium]
MSRRLENDYGMPPFFLDGFDLGSHPLQESADVPYGYIDHRANYTHISVYDVQPAEDDRSLVWLERPNDGPVLIKKSGLRPTPISAQTCRALFIRGDSMQPELNDWDLVIVDTSDVEIIDGEIYAVTYKNQLFIKKLIRGTDGIQLISTNPIYPPVCITDTEATPLVILGRKVWRGG